MLLGGQAGAVIVAHAYAFNDKGSDVPVVQVMHEQAAVHIADAHYRVTGQPIAACTSIGPGAANTVMGLANSYCDSAALLLLSGSASTHMRGHGVMQELDRENVPDFLQVSRSVTKRNFDLMRADHAPFVMHRAFNAMLTGRSRPVRQAERHDSDVGLTSAPRVAALRWSNCRSIDGGQDQLSAKCWS